MIFSRELFFYLSKNYSFIYTGLSENLKARILESVITWSEMGQQTVQAKEVYCDQCNHWLLLIFPRTFGNFKALPGVKGSEFAIFIITPRFLVNIRLTTVVERQLSVVKPKSNQ